MSRKRGASVQLTSEDDVDDLLNRDDDEDDSVQDNPAQISARKKLVARRPMGTVSSDSTTTAPAPAPATSAFQWPSLTPSTSTTAPAAAAASTPAPSSIAAAFEAAGTAASASVAAEKGAADAPKTAAPVLPSFGAPSMPIKWSLPTAASSPSTSLADIVKNASASNATAAAGGATASGADKKDEAEKPAASTTPSALKFSFAPLPAAPPASLVAPVAASATGSASDAPAKPAFSWTFPGFSTPAASSTTPAATADGSNGSSPSKTFFQAGTSSFSSFGSVGGTTPSSTLFGAPIAPSFSLPATWSATPFASKPPAAESSADGDDEKGDGHEPDEPESTDSKRETGEEHEDVRLVVDRAKLYKLIDKKWVERGVGEVHVNVELENSTRARIVMRADKTKKLLLNVAIYSAMVTELASDTTVRLSGFVVEQPNAPATNSESSTSDESNADAGKPKLTFFLIRVRDKKVAANLFDTINRIKKTLPQPSAADGSSSTSSSSTSTSSTTASNGTNENKDKKDDATKSSANAVDDVFANKDPLQIQYMEEKCIVVNENDEFQYYDTKKNCHLKSVVKDGFPHRAFSVFLFNDKDELLLQQRASEKITFPDHWTNTVCSHPLYFEKPDGTAAEEQPELELDQQLGVRRAAQRKLGHELGVPAEDVPIENIEFMTRILYRASSDDVWEEYEVDYCLIVKRPSVRVTPNPNEARDTRWVSKEQLRELLDTAGDKGLLVTPWFKLICNKFLFSWWDSLADLSSKRDPDTLHRLL